MAFKWLKAGWGGINMVKQENIMEGCNRFASGFKKVLESPQLPEAEQVIDMYAKIKGLSDQDLTAKLQPIGRALQKLCQTDRKRTISERDEPGGTGESVDGRMDEALPRQAVFPGEVPVNL
jgi:hypothetical protein